MRIIHIINSLNFGGAEKLLVDTLPLYKSKGIDVSVLTLNKVNNSFSESLKRNDIEIINFKKQYNLYNPIHILKIASKIKSFDVVHVHLFPALYWSVISSLIVRKNIKFILTEHNTSNRRRDIYIFKIIDKIIYKKFVNIIAISEATKTNLLKHLSQTYKNVTVINNGIDVNKFKTALPYDKKEFNINNNSIVLIQVSSFTKQKDQKTLIATLPNLPVNTHIFLVGDGPLRQDCYNYTKSLNLESRVHFLGLRSDVPRLLKTADISVLSSHYEGFGLAIVEGMAAGNACIASNVPGVSEIVENHGLLFTSGNIIALTQQIRKLIDNPEFKSMVSKKCEIRAQHYDINNMIKEYINIYSKLNI